MPLSIDQLSSINTVPCVKIPHVLLFRSRLFDKSGLSWSNFSVHKLTPITQSNFCDAPKMWSSEKLDNWVPSNRYEGILNSCLLVGVVFCFSYMLKFLLFWNSSKNGGYSSFSSKFLKNKGKNPSLFYISPIFLLTLGSLTPIFWRPKEHLHLFFGGQRTIST